ncbi:MAG: hypothetical protein ACK559_17630, partial [bacterium]
MKVGRLISTSRGLRHRLLSRTWLSPTCGLPRLQSPRSAAGAHTPRFCFTGATWPPCDTVVSRSCCYPPSSQDRCAITRSRFRHRRRRL